MVVSSSPECFLAACTVIAALPIASILGDFTEFTHFCSYDSYSKPGHPVLQVGNKRNNLSSLEDALAPNYDPVHLEMHVYF